MTALSLERIDYAHGELTLTGWLARPQGTPRGAILILPTIANFNEAMGSRAQMLADQGFVAMVADFYGEPVTSFEASFPMGAALRANVDTYRARVKAGLDALAAAAPGLTLSAIGYCMGGQAALELARIGAPIALAATFHGLLTSDRPATAETPIAARILVCHGDADPLVPRDQVLGFWQEMDAAGANWHFHSYAGVKHGFTDPDSEARGADFLGYNASADRQSWLALTAMLDEVYG